MPSGALGSGASPGHNRAQRRQAGDEAGTVRDAVPGRDAGPQGRLHAAGTGNGVESGHSEAGVHGHVEVRRERVVSALPVSPVRHDAAVLRQSGLAERRAQEQRRIARLEAGVWEQAPPRRQLRAPATSPDSRQPGASPEGFSFSSPEHQHRTGVRRIGSVVLTTRKEETARFHSGEAEPAVTPALPHGEVQGAVHFGRRPVTSLPASGAAPDTAGVPSEVLAASHTRPTRQVRGLRQRAEALAQERSQAAARRVRRPVPGAPDSGGEQVRAALGNDKSPSRERFDRGAGPAVARSGAPQRVGAARNGAVMGEEGARGGGLGARSQKRPGSARPEDKLRLAWVEPGEAGAAAAAAAAPGSGKRGPRPRTRQTTGAVAGRGMEALLGPTGAGRPEWATAYSQFAGSGASPGEPGQRPQRSHRRVYKEWMKSSIQLV